jgi:hypothetical protein
MSSILLRLRTAFALRMTIPTSCRTRQEQTPRVTEGQPQLLALEQLLLPLSAGASCCDLGRTLMNSLFVSPYALCAFS